MSTWWAVGTAVFFTFALDKVLFGQEDPWTFLGLIVAYLMGYWAARSRRGKG